MDEARAVEGGLAVAEVGAVGRVRHAVAGAVGIDQLREHAADPGANERQRPSVGRMRAIEQGERVPNRQAVRPLLGARGPVVALDDPGHGLLLQPLPRVARGDAGPFGQLAGADARVVGEHLVQPEADPEVRGEHADRAERLAEQALGEGTGDVVVIDGVGVDVGDVGSSRHTRGLPHRAWR